MNHDVYKFRDRGKIICDTNGSDHYIVEGEEPLERTFRRGYGVGFCLANVDKYTNRYDETKNIKDLIKAADYLHILVGFISLSNLEKKEDNNVNDTGEDRTTDE